MARRRMLGDETWARMLEPPIDERDIVRHYTLGTDDHAAVGQKRGDANRLGFALVVLYSRLPSRRRTIQSRAQPRSSARSHRTG